MRKANLVEQNVQRKKKGTVNPIQLRCTACYKSSSNQMESERHYLTHELKYNCHVCQEKFRCLYSCSLHMSEHCEQNFTCCVCSHSTANKTNLLMHINTIHLKMYLLHCKDCGKGFNNSGAKSEHESTHKNNNVWICVVCERQFRHKYDMTVHQRRVHNVTIRRAENSCSICKKTFAKTSRLENHVRNMHNSICDRCGRVFYNIRNLNLHLRIHTGFKPYACAACDKRFVKKQLLDEHIRTHTGEKPFACEYCGKCFSQRTPLRIHTRIHTGEKPYVCQFCSKCYTSNGALSSHMKSCMGKLPRKAIIKKDVM